MKELKTLLNNLKKGKITIAKTLAALKDLPFEDVGFAKIDRHRHLRRGFPEVVFGQGKKIEEIKTICERILYHHKTLLVTRIGEDVYKYLNRYIKVLKYDALGRIAYVEMKKAKAKGLILVITAGTSDLSVAREAYITAKAMGNRTKILADVGVAGVHRLFKNMKLIRRANVLIVVAGMEGALASVVSGLVSKPVIAVPTSVGYGASFKGIAPLLTMLNSCSPGVAVVNIDNGFGAGYFASLVNK